MHAGGASADHGLHQFKAFSTPPKPASASATIGRWYSMAGIARVDALDHWISSARLKALLMRSTTFGWVNRIQRLVRVHGGVFVVVGGNLPAGQVDGLMPALAC